MAQPVFYQTLSNLGVDPTVYYVNTASVTPETPAPPFLVGTKAFGSDGSEFVFVQASTTINLTDFIAINSGSPGGGTYQANSLSTTTADSSILVGIGSAGLVLKQSLTYIPAGAYFWALTKGQFVPASTSYGLASNNPPVVLFATATAGVISSVTVTTLQTLAGIVCINSLTVSIPSSIVPPAGGTQSNGFTVGPVVNMNNPRFALVISSAAGTFGASSYAF